MCVWYSSTCKPFLSGVPLGRVCADPIEVSPPDKDDFEFLFVDVFSNVFPSLGCLEGLLLNIFKGWALFPARPDSPNGACPIPTGSGSRFPGALDPKGSSENKALKTKF